MNFDAWISFSGQLILMIVIIWSWIDSIKIRKENAELGRLLHKHIKDSCENR